jgi:glutaconyl-CoA/methylmalonyl-CoA decarboxylase subunit gamma
MKRTFRFVYQGEEIEVKAERKGETLKIERDGREYTLTLLSDGLGDLSAEGTETDTESKNRLAETAPASQTAFPRTDKTSTSETLSSPGDIPAPMTGVIKECIVSVGDRVKEGEKLMIMEAMKMDIEVSSFSAGTVTKVYVSSADNVQEGQPLLRVE